jgi:hypothetical protein
VRYLVRGTELDRLKSVLKAGSVYRRQDLVHLSSNVDRHLALLVQDGTLKRLNQGLYTCPAKTAFGEAPADEMALLRSFLREDHFVVYSPNSFNGLGLGTTQLYNQRVVFNRKRHGQYTVGNRSYLFLRWREAPKHLTAEFLVVALLNRLDELAEDREEVLFRLRSKLRELNLKRLNHAAKHYGTYSTQLKLRQLLRERREPHVG